VLLFFLRGFGGVYGGLSTAKKNIDTLCFCPDVYENKFALRLPFSFVGTAIFVTHRHL
jgi:hypothetical protein